MSAPSSNSSPSLAQGRPRPRWTSLLSRAARLAVMLVLIAVGLMLVQTFRTLLHDAPEAKAPETASETVTKPDRNFRVEKLSETLLQPGAWSLGDSDWSLATADLSVAAAEARLQSLGKPTTGESKPSTLEETVLVWLRQFRPAIVDGCRVYNAPLGSARVRAVSEKRGGRERLRLAQLMWKQGRSTRLLEASPAPTSSVHGREDGHLLPLPVGVASLARRWDNAGGLSCEILGPASREECLRGWSKAGWTAEKITEAQGPFSLTGLRSGGHGVCLCAVEAGPAGSPPYLLLMAESAEQ